MTQTQKALDYLQRKGSARSTEIAEACGLNPTAVSALFAGHVKRGELLMCKVERPGKPPCNEYRLSAMAGGKLAEFRPLTRTAAQARAEKPTQPAGPPARTLKVTAAPQPTLDRLPIDKGIAIPDPKVLRRNIIANTLRALEPGDSFVVKPSTVSTIYRRSKELHINVRIAKLQDGRARIWRLV